jgi:oligosaccharide repeat unit polymerase
MFYIVLNALLYVITFASVRKYHPGLSIGNTLLGLYTLVAVACVITYALDIQYFELELWPLLYLYVAFLLSSYPLTLKRLTVNRFKIRRLPLAYLIIIIMVVAAIINIFYSLNSTVQLVENEEIQEMYSEKESIETSINALDWLAKNILGYGSLPFYMIVFYFLTLNKKKSTYIAGLSFAVVFASIFLMSAMRVLRWNILHNTICAISGYLIFYNQIAKEKRKIINMVVGIFALVVVGALVIIAMARFAAPGASYGGSPVASLIFYLGHSMMVFDYGIVDTINTFAEGKFMLGIPITQNLGTHNGGDFPTYIGNLYVDFGPFITIIICAIVGVIFNHRRKVNCLADAFLISYYYVFLCMGVFSHAMGYIKGWIFCILLYWVMKRVF